MTGTWRRFGWVPAAALVWLAAARGEDWPMYRHDASRTAGTKQELPGQLYLQWVRQLPERHAAMSYDRRMEHDNGYQPIVVGKTMFVGLEYNNALLAMDTDTGKTKWTFYVNGPIRFAPAAMEGRSPIAIHRDWSLGMVYVAPEDAVLYCLDAETGKLKWRYDGAASPRKIFNHERLTSNWSTSGGPVAAYGMVLYGTGVWPIDGTYCHALAASSGDRLWRSRARIAWGYMTMMRNWGVLPSGKTPNVYDVSNGKGMPNGAYDVKNLPTALMSAWQDTHLFNGNKAYPMVPNEPVYKTYANAEHHTAIWTPIIDEDRVYGFNDGILKAYRKPAPEELAKMKRKDLVPIGGLWYVNHRPNYVWSANVGEPMPLPPEAKLPKDWYPCRMEMKAGPRLFASGPDAVIAIDDFAAEGKKPRVSWIGRADGRVTAVLAADDKLFVTCESGKVYCFAGRKVQPRTQDWPPPKPAPPADAATAAAKAILDATKITEGYCYVWRLTDGRLAEELRRQSGLRVIGIDPDEAKVNALRRRFDAAGVLDRRLVLMWGDPQTFELPPYTGSLIVTEDAAAALKPGQAFAAEMFAALRPYGGSACLALSDAQHAKLAAWSKQLKLPKAKLARTGGLTMLTRQGALVGADNWTHERHDPANTLISRDDAFVPPVGLLWWGGPAADWARMFAAFLPPGLQVVDGLYIMQGHGLISAIDVYTGRLAWDKQVPKVQYYGAYIGEYPKDAAGKPLYPELGGKHFMGVSGHGQLITGDIELAKLSGNSLNMISLPDRTYLAVGEDLWVCDTKTGRTLETRAIPFKDPDAKRPLCWGTIKAAGDVLACTAFDPADVRAAWLNWHQGNEKNKQRMPMRWLFAVERGTGKLLWKRRAASGWLNWGSCLGNDRLYAVDLVIPGVMAAYAKIKYRTDWPQPMVHAFDLKTGRGLWKDPVNVLCPNPAYHEAKDILVMPARTGVYWHDGRWVTRTVDVGEDGRKLSIPAAAPGEMWALRGADGKKLWHVKGTFYGEPVMIYPEWIVTRHGRAFDINTGEDLQRPDPLTGQMRPWRVSAGGCNFLIGSTHVSAHRICYQDMDLQQVVPLPGMRSGCTPSILPANGVMTVFNYTHNYPSDELRSAYVLVPRPQNANYTSYGSRQETSIARVQAAGGPLPRLGLNFAAPGDLMAPDGTPWLAQGIPVPPVKDRRGRTTTPPSLIALKPDTAGTFEQPPSSVQAAAPAWAPVAATGFKGAQEILVTLVPGAPADAKPVAFTVRLHFLEPDDVKPGRRVFNVSLQGRKVLDRFDVAAAAGGRGRAAVREFKAVQVGNVLKIELQPIGESLPAVISGVEVVNESAAGPAAKAAG